MNFPVVGIGASAGGLDACRKFVSALPAATGMAFILVQHLDPNHPSMLVDLLSGHTTLTVREAANGMPIELEHLYVIPPGTYLSIGEGVLRLSQPQARHGARLPFDYLLNSLALDRGRAAICVILSGSGADGTLGLQAIKEHHGLVMAQSPDEAGFDGMPRSAIMTGSVDFVLPVAAMPDAMSKYMQRIGQEQELSPAPRTTHDRLPDIIDLLRAKTAHDFTLYKTGTLRRRIERRMVMAAIETGDMARYLELLETDPQEPELLAKDLLINVTSFFRDPLVFDLLSETIIPDLVREQPPEQPLRIWVAGCSTGEETYSLAMLFQEHIAQAKRAVKLQVFASDVDPEAVASAREGLYPATIEAEVSPSRLARFFGKEDRGYRILPELRGLVVFTVQDVLTDPPFSRIDMVSCRNLLIYLRPDAQAKVLSLFHFALRDGGILLLGGSETAGSAEGHFQVIAKHARLYRHLGRGRTSQPVLALGTVRPLVQQVPGPERSRQAMLADMCRRLVLETQAPAAVLVNRKLECLFVLGPADRYLRVAPGAPTNDLLTMAHPDMRTKLRSAIQQANQEKSRVIAPGARITHAGQSIAFAIDVMPVLSEGEALLLICFVAEPVRDTLRAEPGDVRGVAVLEQELESTRAELQGAIRSLEISNEDQKAINEEALSVQEEFQSTNEELLTSKEELQSLNEELTALNSQLQETLDRQRTTANDLQNILYSSDVATIFLDEKLNIRFFTPATRSLFNVLPGDIGRPLSDLTSLAADDTLLQDAAGVLSNLVPREREVQARNGSWFFRRILPYKTQDNRIEGVVITFSDITVKTLAANALTMARREADQANIAKSRFLAAASHDLRQPLQTLSLVRGILNKKIKQHKTEEALELVQRLDQMADTMTGMLDTLLDINQIEAGVVHPKVTMFPISGLLDRLTHDFTYHGNERNVVFRCVQCSAVVRSDPRLLEQMLRNLLSNAMKYTRQGKVLLGCRRHGNLLLIQVLDTGIGIYAEDLELIFEDYHQVDNPARERGQGLGLGLPIVQRLAHLLGHKISVRSRPNKGSVFTVEVALMPEMTGRAVPADVKPPDAEAVPRPGRSGEILLVEDDPEVRELLALLLREAGHRVTTAHDGVQAVAQVTGGALRPDLILADYNLPNGINGAELATRLRRQLGREIPVIVLTGDISTATLRAITERNYVQLNKPVSTAELIREIERLLPPSPLPRQLPAAGEAHSSVIYVVDDDDDIRASIRAVLEQQDRIVEDFGSCEAFLANYRPGGEACLIIDAYLPGMSGLELLRRLSSEGHGLPAIMITGNGDVSIAVQAMKAGASDFVEKPIGHDELLACVDRALEQSRDTGKRTAWREYATSHVAGLTARQHQIMEMVLAGHPSKNIAADLGISQRTVENHRASIMKKTGAKSLPALARLAVAAADDGKAT